MSLVACVLLSSAGTKKGDKENLLEFGDHHSRYCTWVVIFMSYTSIQYSTLASIVKVSVRVTSFPGLPTVQFLIACGMLKRLLR